MSDFKFNVPKLLEKGAWFDYRFLKGGYISRGNRDLNKVSTLFIHHTVTNQEKNLDKEVRYVHYLHTDIRKFNSIGYNFIVSSEEINGYAKVAYTLDLIQIGYHTANLKGCKGVPARLGNVYGIGIAIVGNFVNVNPNNAQLRSIHELIKELVYQEDSRLPLLKDWDVMIPHYLADATACPGNWNNYKPLVIDPPVIEPQKDNLYHVYRNDTELGAYSSESKALDKFIDDAANKVLYNNVDLTFQFKNNMNRLEQAISDLTTEMKKLKEDLSKYQINEKKFEQIIENMQEDLKNKIMDINNKYTSVYKEIGLEDKDRNPEMLKEAIIEIKSQIGKGKVFDNILNFIKDIWQKIKSPKKDK